MLDDVAGFLLGGRREELVILKLSCRLDGLSVMRGLVDAVCGPRSPVAPFLVRGVARPGSASLSALLSTQAAHGAVLCVFEGLDDGLYAPEKGVYGHRDVRLDAGSARGDLVACDDPADTPDLDGMQADRLRRLADPRAHHGDLFVLPWTLAQHAGASGPDAALARADEVNPLLPAFLARWMRDHWDPAKLPNVVCADAVSPALGYAVVGFLDRVLARRDRKAES